MRWNGSSAPPNRFRELRAPRANAATRPRPRTQQVHHRVRLAVGDGPQHESIDRCARRSTIRQPWSSRSALRERPQALEHGVSRHELCEEIGDLVQVREVVIEHPSRHLGQSDRADPLLPPDRAPWAPVSERNVRRFSARAAANAASATAGSGFRYSRSRVDPLPVEVGEERVVLSDQPPDPLAEPFPLQIGEVPEMLDERERTAAHAHQHVRKPRRDLRQERRRARQRLESVHGAN